jgi:predicted neuraminidase
MESQATPRELVAGQLSRGPVKNKPVVLTDGAWLVGGSVKRESGESVLFVDRSGDGGKTWKRSADIMAAGICLV